MNESQLDCRIVSGMIPLAASGLIIPGIVIIAALILLAFLLRIV